MTQPNDAASAAGSVAEMVDLGRRLDQERLRALVVELGSDSLAWLAVVPTWTRSIAEAASFPSGAFALDGWLARAEEAGLVEQEPELRADPETGREFWISESDRPFVLDLLRSQGELGDDGLRRITADIAGRLKRMTAPPGGMNRLPESLEQWAHLAAAAKDPAQAARQLDREVEQLTRDSRLGEARATVAAGHALARTLGGALDGAVALSTRRLEVAYRQASDARHLRHYFRRPDQEQAFDALLEPSSPAWALHYLGMGGIGKTMLLRRITGQIAKAQDLPVSRIDFDHLSPDYPVRRPGQLLLALAAELRPYAGTSNNRLLDYLFDATQELHELTGAEPPPNEPLHNVHRPEFARLLAIFADLLHSLRPPVVLLLDTCEELARVPVVNRVLPAVEATFDMLSRVHDAVPSVRVVFAGRRPLASSGLGWSLRARADRLGELPIDPSDGLRPFLPARPFLRLQEIQGLTADEAHLFLTESWNLPLKRRGALERAVLSRSRESARTIVSTSRVDEPHYNPFDLALYAGWLKDDPKLRPDDITAGGSDPYVDVRIVQRVQQPQLKEALAAIVDLGRVDEAALAAILPDGISSQQVSDLYRALADYEWTEQQRDPQSNTLYLEVDRHLLPRLRKYFNHPARAAALQSARNRLAPGLERLIRDTRLGDLGVHQLEAALALLPARAAARLWVDVLCRAPMEADWNWLRNVTERLLGVDGVLPRQPALARGLAAAKASLDLQLAGGTRATTDVDAAIEWPDADTGPWLDRLSRIRSIDADTPIDEASSRLAELLRSFTSVPAAQTADDEMGRRRSEEEAAALLRVAEAVVDRWDERAAGEGRLPLVELLGWTDVIAANDYPQLLVAMAEVIVARAAAGAGQLDITAKFVERAPETAAIEGALDATRRWLFWQPPASAVDRVRLEALLLHRELVVGPSPDADRWLVGAGALSRTDTIDGERLASAVEMWLLERGLPEISELGISEVADVYVTDRRPSTRAHRRTPPLFVTLANKRAALGDFAAADKILRDRATVAEASRQDAETVMIATLARVDLARRSRFVPDDLSAAVVGLSRSLREQADARPVWALLALTGIDLTDGFTPTPHDAWATTATNAAEVGRLLLNGIRSKSDASVASLPMTAAIDLVEAARVGHRSLDHSPRAAGVDHLDDLLRAMLRLYALDPIDQPTLGTVRVPPHLRHLLPFSFRYVAPLVVRSGAQPVERAQLVAMVETWRHKQPRDGETVDPEPAAPQSFAGFAHRLEDHVGWRRLAALAQDEGELLALRLPEAGGRLLRVAADLSVAGHDHVAAVVAGVSAQLADARAGTGHEDLDLAALVRRSWQHAHAPGLPQWEPRAPVSEGPWQGWACRTAVVRALTGGRADESTTRLLARYRKSRASPELAFVPRDERDANARTVGLVPAKERPSSEKASLWSDVALVIVLLFGGLAFFVYLVGSGALIVPMPHAGEASTWPFQSIGFSWTLVWLVLAIATVGAVCVWRPPLRDVAVGWGLFIALLCFAYTGIGLLSDVILRRVLGPWERLVTVVGCIVTVGTLAFGGVRLWRWWRSLVARRSEAMVWISVAKSWDVRDGLSGTHQAIWQCSCLRAETRFPLVAHLRDLPPWSMTVNVADLRQVMYADAAGITGGGSMSALAAIRAELNGAVWTVPMYVEGAAHVPWEALLTGAVRAASTAAILTTAVRRALTVLNRVRAAQDDPVFFYRSDPRRANGTHAAVAGGPVAVLGDASDVALEWRRTKSQIQDHAEGASIVHVVGVPVLSTRGPRLRLSGKAPGGEQFVNRETLPQNLSLLIVQQTPAEAPARLATDREQAALLRAAAAELFDAGYGAVIVIPSLPPALARRVVSEVVRALTEAERRPLAIFDRRDRTHVEFMSLVWAVRHARKQILTFPEFPDADETSESDPREAAWDVCLYARSGPASGRVEHRSPADETRH